MDKQQRPGYTQKSMPLISIRVRQCPDLPPFPGRVLVEVLGRISVIRWSYPFGCSLSSIDTASIGLILVCADSLVCRVFRICSSSITFERLPKGQAGQKAKMPGFVEPLGGGPARSMPWRTIFRTISPPQPPQFELPSFLLRPRSTRPPVAAR